MSVLDRFTRNRKDPEAIDSILADPYGRGQDSETDTQTETDSAVNAQDETEKGSLSPDLVRRLEALEKQNSDKDRMIGELKGQVTSYNQMFDKLPALAGPAPQEDSDPVEIDPDTLNMFKAKFENDPTGAIADMMAFYRDSLREDVTASKSLIEEKERDREIQEKQKQALMRAEQHILTQIDQAVNTYGEAAGELKQDLLQNQENSVIGQAIKSDPYLAMTQTGIYDFVEKRVGTQGSPSPRVDKSPGVTGVARPQAPRRDLSSGSDSNVSEEDRIRNAIRGARKPGTKATDKQREFFTGTI